MLIFYFATYDRLSCLPDSFQHYCIVLYCVIIVTIRLIIMMMKILMMIMMMVSIVAPITILFVSDFSC